MKNLTQFAYIMIGFIATIFTITSIIVLIDQVVVSDNLAMLGMFITFLSIGFFGLYATYTVSETLINVKYPKED
jgi:hypothetical protein